MNEQAWRQGLPTLWTLSDSRRESERAPSSCCSRSAISSQAAVQTQPPGFCRWDPIHPAKTTRNTSETQTWLTFEYSALQEITVPSNSLKALSLLSSSKEHQRYDRAILLLEVQPHPPISLQQALELLSKHLSLPVPVPGSSYPGPLFPAHLLNCFASSWSSCLEFSCLPSLSFLSLSTPQIKARQRKKSVYWSSFCPHSSSLCALWVSPPESLWLSQPQHGSQHNWGDLVKMKSWATLSATRARHAARGLLPTEVCLPGTAFRLHHHQNKAVHTQAELQQLAHASPGAGQGSFWHHQI